jgi:Bacterial transglutaminase-like N-terminal region
MLRPRESRELRLVSTEMTISPTAVVTWANDIFGNTVATAIFQTESDILQIESVTDIELTTAPWPVFDIAARAIRYPFKYSNDEETDLWCVGDSAVSRS